jgi:hypothetical protein
VATNTLPRISLALNPGYSCQCGFKAEKTIMAFNFEMELQASGLVQAVLTGVTLAIIGTLTSIPFSWLQIIIVMVVVIVASFLASAFSKKSSRSSTW